MDTKAIVIEKTITSWRIRETDVPINKAELEVLMEYLDWLRNSEYSEYKALKTARSSHVDIIVSNRHRKELNQED